MTANMEDRGTRLAVLKNKQTGAFGQISATITLEELRQMQQEVASILVPDAINEWLTISSASFVRIWRCRTESIWAIIPSRRPRHGFPAMTR